MRDTTTSHPGELRLRRHRAGESVSEDVRAHAEACEVCQRRLRGFDEEQLRFESELPFERVAAGVERAHRALQRPSRPSTLLPALGAALAASLLLSAGLLLLRSGPEPNRLKGGAGLEVVVSGLTQRSASTDPATPEALAAGERVRIGLHAADFGYALVVSVDEQGLITPLYADQLADPSRAQSLPLSTKVGSDEVQYLPDSLEFTGPGLERVVVILTHSPLTVEQVSKALRSRLEEARGQLTQLQPLDLPGEQFHRTFLKP